MYVFQLCQPVAYFLWDIKLRNSWILFVLHIPWVFYLASVGVRSAATYLQPNLYHYLDWKNLSLESFQDFLIKLDINPRMHLVEISIFSLNNITVRLTKIMNNLLKHLKILIFILFFSVKNWRNLSKKNFLWRILD